MAKIRQMFRPAKIGLIFALLLTGFSVPDSGAHQTTQSYLALASETNLIRGRWAIGLRDLDHVLTIDANKDGEVSDEELEKNRRPIEKYAFDRLRLEISGERVNPTVTGFETEEHTDMVYSTLLFEFPLSGADLLISYSLFFETDPLHRGLFRFDFPERTETAIFSPSQPVQRFLVGSPETSSVRTNFIREGIHHIWIGYDHILFVLALLLPSVLKRENGSWTPEISWRSSVANIVKVVTAFTIAHSITLSLAVLEALRPSPRIIEPFIAASVAMAALNNIRVILPERIWAIAFAFGLIHGFGFAAVLSELGLPKANLGRALLEFNIGVELGQLAIVGAFVPIALYLRQFPLYVRQILPIGSGVIALLAGIWMAERMFDQTILPF